MGRTMMAAFAMLALAGALAAVPNWDITGEWDYVYILGAGNYYHTMQITSFDLVSGNFSGNGYYDANPAYTWIITGNVDGDTITYHIDYTGLNPSYYVDGTGTVDNATAMHGTAAAPGQSAAWTATGGTAVLVDGDGDGVNYASDLCEETSADVLQNSLGTNRLTWNGSQWVTLSPKDKVVVDSSVTMGYTYGCSCTQILGNLVDKTGLSFDGHYKYGCSKSVVEDWHAGTYHVGPTYLETVEVPSGSASGASSVNTLETGKTYYLKAYGTANAGDSIDFDAQYSFRTGSSTEWTDAVSTYESYGTQLLDLFVDNADVEWGAYNALHAYTITVPGTGAVVSLKVYDVYYPNNVGSLMVDLIEDKWVDLW